MEHRCKIFKSRLVFQITLYKFKFLELLTPTVQFSMEFNNKYFYIFKEIA